MGKHTLHSHLNKSSQTLPLVTRVFRQNASEHNNKWQNFDIGQKKAVEKYDHLTRGWSMSQGIPFRPLKYLLNS